MKFLKYDISFFLITVLSLAFIVFLVNFLVSGAYQNLYSRAQGIHKIFLHFTFMVIPVLTGLAALHLNREEDYIWRQIKLWMVAMPLFIYGSYWVYASFNIGLVYSIDN